MARALALALGIIARADLDFALLLEQFGIRQISLSASASTTEKGETDTGDGTETTSTLGSHKLQFESDGFSGDALAAYLGPPASGQGPIAYTKGSTVSRSRAAHSSSSASGPSSDGGRATAGRSSSPTIRWPSAT